MLKQITIVMYCFYISKDKWNVTGTKFNYIYAETTTNILALNKPCFHP